MVAATVGATVAPTIDPIQGRRDGCADSGGNSLVEDTYIALQELSRKGSIQLTTKTRMNGGAEFALKG